jgi:carbon storage regulator CsrA
MQILQRGINQSVVIGEDLVVTVLEIQPSFVRLGINDPNSNPAYREETLFVNDDEDDFFHEIDDEDAETYDSAEFACPAF